MASSTLAGVLILVGMPWAYLIFQRLWQGSLREEAADALALAASRGFVLRPAGWRARLVARGQWAGRDAAIEWRGGPFGPSSRVRVGDRVQDLPLLTSGPELARVLDSWTPPERTQPEAVS